MDLLGKCVIIALVAAGILYALQPRYLFVIRIAGESVRVTRGKATPAFLNQTASACAEFKVLHGWIGGVKRGKRVSLVFSRSIPWQCQQRLRNLWCFQG